MTSGTVAEITLALDAAQAALIKELETAGGQVDDFVALANDRGMRREIAAAMLKYRQDARTKVALRGEMMTVHVGYGPNPSHDELEKRFGDFCFAAYDGRALQRHPMCVEIDETPGERKMSLLHLDRRTCTDEVLAEMKKRGLRPAIDREAFPFIDRFPDLQMQFPIVVLGVVFKQQCLVNREMWDFCNFEFGTYAEDFCGPERALLSRRFSPFDPNTRFLCVLDDR